MEIPKIPLKYNCELCDYHTSSKKDYDKRSATDKHKGNKKVVKIPQNIIAIINDDVSSL